MKPLRVLIVEDNPAYARLVKETLSDSGGFDTHLVARLDEAMRRLADDLIDIVLLDLGLPDARGVDRFHRLGEAFPDVPVVVLTGFDDEQMAIDIVREGAQDYLVKGRAENDSLARALRYAVERHRMQNQLRQQALVDELTGLHNRRGFVTLASHQLKVAGRQNAPLVLLFADLDGLKTINDTFGHAEGDRALIDTADVLRSSIRSSDVVARLSGDEFCALLSECVPSTATLVMERLQDAVRSHNRASDRPYTLSLSVGVATYDPERDRDIDELMRRADRSMYREKAGRMGST
jgi:two-component system, cell cycle response regulator